MLLRSILFLLLLEFWPPTPVAAIIVVAFAFAFVAVASASSWCRSNMIDIELNGSIDTW